MPPPNPCRRRLRPHSHRSPRWLRGRRPRRKGPRRARLRPNCARFSSARSVSVLHVSPKKRRWLLRVWRTTRRPLHLSRRRRLARRLVPPGVYPPRRRPLSRFPRSNRKRVWPPSVPRRRCHRALRRTAVRQRVVRPRPSRRATTSRGQRLAHRANLCLPPRRSRRLCRSPRRHRSLQRQSLQRRSLHPHRCPHPLSTRRPRGPTARVVGSRKSPRAKCAATL